MLESYPKIFELCISMLTALLGMAYPLFIDKINKMTEKYNTRHISEKFRRETSYRIFSVLIVICIIELFVFPVIINAFETECVNLSLITVQGICVFTLSIVMVRLYHLIMTYADPFRLFDRSKANDTEEELFEDLQILIQYASKNEANLDLFQESIKELVKLVVKFQKIRLSNHDN